MGEQDERVVWLHLGVAAQQEGFKLEECAVNGSHVPTSPPLLCAVCVVLAWRLIVRQVE
jgi:hypothetical protein